MHYFDNKVFDIIDARCNHESLNFVAQQSGCAAMAVSNFKFSNMSPNAKKRKVSNNLCFGDISSLVLVSSLCTRCVINSYNSPTIGGHIHK